MGKRRARQTHVVGGWTEYLSAIRRCYRWQSERFNLGQDAAVRTYTLGSCSRGHSRLASAREQWLTPPEIHFPLGAFSYTNLTNKVPRMSTDGLSDMEAVVEGGGKTRRPSRTRRPSHSRIDHRRIMAFHITLLQMLIHAAKIPPSQLWLRFHCRPINLLRPFPHR